MATDTITQHSHEPEEGNPRKWNQIQRKADRIPGAGVGNPLAFIRWIGRDSKPDQYQTGDIKRRKDHAGDGDDPRGRRRRASFGLWRAHRISLPCGAAVIVRVPSFVQESQ